MRLGHPIPPHPKIGRICHFQKAQPPGGLSRRRKTQDRKSIALQKPEYNTGQRGRMLGFYMVTLLPHYTIPNNSNKIYERWDMISRSDYRIASCTD
ncbi:hypothetical protein AAC387_Pa01g2122 [Persea americana]